MRQAAMQAVVTLRAAEATPRLLALAQRDETRADATLALAAMPDPRALPVYLAALRDRNAELLRARRLRCWRSGRPSRPTW
ncbi:MAG: hypothetical protein U0835_10540 [Isosphaeraceae bacterium]